MLLEETVNQLWLLAHVVLAMVLGAVTGFERERANKPAGLRTHMFVAGSAALLVVLSETLITSSSLPIQMIRTDPIRIIEAIITGISFLGAGTILRHQEKGDVEGLTTAASLLFVAGVGIAVGTDKFILATGMAALSFVVLRFVKKVPYFN